MAKEKRIYLIEGSQMVDQGEPIGEVYMPDFSVVPTLIDGYEQGTDDDHWDVIYSEDSTAGISNSAMVGIYTTLENHDLLEAEPHITRVDDKPNLRAMMRQLNSKVPEDVVDKLKNRRK